MKYKVKKISSQLSYSIMKEIAKEKKLDWLDATSN